eukprot:TRINITY_DN865_c0_g1_i1.p1 TRINITY_DN865_c0_g1~~TRINITY_DN865_c0_g1_i1.p1  ORF type:complete len:380 (+),score=93.76 TRINITY_DN865_c0_g1_i1:2007-3146(+)
MVSKKSAMKKFKTKIDRTRSGRSLLMTDDDEQIFPWDIRLQKKNSFMKRGLLDTFGDSLRHVDTLYTKEFGSENRKVPAHMPHFMDKRILIDLHQRFPVEWSLTSSHKFRSSYDMQFAFSYFYYMMNKKRTFDFDDAWDEFDVDGSGFLGLNELRSLTAHLLRSPVNDEKMTYVAIDILNSTTCSHTYNSTSELLTNDIEKLLSKQCALGSPDFVDKLKKRITSKKQYKFESRNSDEVAFVMIGDNLNSTLKSLDGIREKRHRFICLNDNMNHTDSSSTKVVQALHDFYQSLFPYPSAFELPTGAANDHLHVDESNIPSANILQKYAAGRRELTHSLKVLPLYCAIFLSCLLVTMVFLQCLSKRSQRRRIDTSSLPHQN